MLPDLVKDDLEKHMQIEELPEIVKESENNKSKGLDGLSYEFYKTIQEDLIKMFQCQLNRKKIVDNNREGSPGLHPRLME